MAAKRILIVEDDAAIRDMLALALRRADFLVSAAADVNEARLSIADSWPDLLLVDWMMPGTSGIEFVRELRAREHTRDFAIIMITARAEDEDAVRGLNVGCDDYVSKPFSVPELIARIRAVLRRGTAVNDVDAMEIGGLKVEAGSQRVSARGEAVHLGPTEYRLLHFFISHPERVYSREQVLDRVWGQNTFIEERTVDVHIRRLRKALEPFGYAAMIQTVRGTGYRFSARV
jgi:two-component system phosphate regulon response regulator PhoB